MMNEIDNIKKCVELIETKLNWSKDKTILRNDFESLRASIIAVSGIEVSVETLQRVFGKKRTYKNIYNPQLQTKDALSIFLGYLSWDDFKRSINAADSKDEAGIIPDHKHVNQELNSASAQTTKIGQNTRKFQIGDILHKSKFRMILLTFVAMGALLVILIWLFRKPSETVFVLDAKPDSGYPPNSVDFTYQIGRKIKDSVFMYFDDYNLTKYLPTNSNTIRNSFLIPNYTMVMVKAGGKVLATKGILTKSIYWDVLAHSGDHFTIPMHDTLGILYISPGDYSKNRATLSTDLWGVYQYFTDFNADGDNLTLETRIINNENMGGISCYDTEIELVCENDFAKIIFLEPKCESYAKVYFGEKKLNGAYTDLSAFGQNLSDWSDVKVEIRNKKARILFNRKFIYQCNYDESLGKLKGMRFRFKGFGAVDFVKVSDTSGKIIYYNDFGGPAEISSLINK